MLKQRLPPLEPLIAFEAAARLLSFTRAAEELHLSQAAVSQQIRSLEERLQVRLFTRSHRAVQLTNEGREYQHSVSLILRQLAGATTDIRNVEFSRQLVIGCDHSFASLWLRPRLAELRHLLPQVTLRLVVDDAEAQIVGGEVQASILHGDGHWPGYRTLRLLDEEIYPVCSPGLDHVHDGDWLGWLLRAQLIDLADNQWNWINWRLWLGDRASEQPLANRALQINNYPLVIDAACAGLGVALGWDGLIDDYLADGRLVRPVDDSLATEFGYYLIYPESLADDAVLMQLQSWLASAFRCRAGT